MNSITKYTNDEINTGILASSGSTFNAVISQLVEKTRHPHKIYNLRQKRLLDTASIAFAC